MTKNLETVGVQVEKHHHEVATAGQAEIDLRFDSLTNMADKVTKFKYVVRNTAVKAGKTATFMPKPIYGDNGSGMHVHISIWKNKKPLFYKKGGFADLSDLAMHFIAGLFAHASALAAEGNRSAIVRVPGFAKTPKAKHFEYRAPDPTANPYLAFSALLMAGIDGVKKKMGPPMTTTKNLFDMSPAELKKIKQLPATLSDALNALEKDHAFLLEGGVFTKDLIESYIDLKMEEIKLVNEHPNPMEFDLYFDL
jgi:glutamine synthetase